MSRARRALTAAGFSYAQTALSVAVNLYLVRFLLIKLGASTWGLWLASGALIGYAGFAELGVFGILPWLVAEADGRQDLPQLRSLLVHGLLMGVFVAVAFLSVAALLWQLFPGVLHLSAQDRAILSGPLSVVVAAAALGYPLRAFHGVLLGLQDYVFTGVAGLLQVVLNAGLVLTLVSRGHGLFALGVGAAVPPLALGVASLVRVVICRRELLRDWHRPQLSVLRPLLSSGMGAWMGSVGWELASASNAVVIAYLGHRELVAVYAVTSRLGSTLTNLGWTLPDSGLVGLAQLHTQGPHHRVVEVVSAILGLNLYLSGGVACLILAVNPGFVPVWAGANLFGGHALNGLLALDAVVLSVIHGLLVTASVLGNRVLVGSATLMNGLAHVICALILGRFMGLPGIALATLVSGLVTTFPIGVRQFVRFTGNSVRSVAGALVAPWLLRWIPLAALAAVSGWWLGGGHARWFPVAGAVVGLLWLWSSRSYLSHLSLGTTVQRLFERLRLIPAK